MTVANVALKIMHSERVKQTAKMHRHTLHHLCMSGERLLPTELCLDYNVYASD